MWVNGATCNPRSRTWWSFPPPRWRTFRRCIRRCISGVSSSGCRSRPPRRTLQSTPPRRPREWFDRWRTLAAPGRSLAQARLDTQTLKIIIKKTPFSFNIWPYRFKQACCGGYTSQTHLRRRDPQCNHFHSDSMRLLCRRSDSGRVCRRGGGRGWTAPLVGYTARLGILLCTHSGMTARPEGCTFHGRI